MKNVLAVLLVTTLTICIGDVAAVNGDVLAAVRRDITVRKKKKMLRRNLATMAPKAVSTKGPTGCADSEEKFEAPSVTWLTTPISCKWVKRTDTEWRCTIDEAVENCPETCGGCDSECEDVEGKFEAPSVPWVTTPISCNWVKRMDTKWRCKIDEVMENCKATCDLC